MYAPHLNSLAPHSLPHSAVGAKVYSYTRFSTPEQAKGDSYRRQTEAAERWATARGLALDNELSILDEGVSAFRGTNATDGGLATFLQLCQRGLIEPGSYLVVESLDRISRMEPLYAQQIFSSIVMSGVTIVTLSDGQEYSTQSLRQNPMGLMMALMVSFRAYEESATKGRRVAAAWAEKRRKVAAGEAKRLTTRGPSWLRPDGEGWAEIPERAETVRRIFQLTLSGMGEHSIAKLFTREGVPVLGRGAYWHRSTISKVLRNPAVIGTLTPGHIEYVNGKRVRQLEKPIPKAFPAIVSEADWLSIRALKDGAAPAVRGRHAPSGVAHMLAGLARCPACASTMVRVNKGGGGKAGQPKLVCSKAKVGAGCPYVSVRVSDVDGALLGDWGGLLADVPAGDRNERLDKEYAALSCNIEGVESLLYDLADALAAAPSTTGASRVARLEAEVRMLRKELEELDERRAAADKGLIRSRLDDCAALFRQAKEAGETPDPTAVNAALKVLFSSVVIDHPQGLLRFQWRQGGETCLRYAWVDHE